MKVDSKTHRSSPLVSEAECWEVEPLIAGDPLRASVVLARRGAEVALFDTGLAQHEASLRAALAARGLTPDDVTLVFNTHTHVDHSHNSALFGRARIYCSARDRQWTRALHAALVRAERFDSPELDEFYPELGAIDYDPKIVRKMFEIEKLLWDEARIGAEDRCVWLEEAELPAGIRAVATPGHVPYHTSFVITTRTRPVIVAGDALLMRGEAQGNLQLMPPHDSAAYRRSQLLVLSLSGLIVPGHDAPFENHSDRC